MVFINNLKDGQNSWYPGKQNKTPSKYLLKAFRNRCDFQMAFLRQSSSCKSSLAKESLSLSFTHSVLEEGIGLRKTLINVSLSSRKESFLPFVQRYFTFER